MDGLADAAPLVSVVIPTYHRRDSLVRAIRSVKQQSYTAVELIVVDDSGEGYARDLVDAEVTYIEFERNRGPSAARNAGIREAEGRYIKFLDDDDWLVESSIRRLVSAVESHDDAKVAYSGIQYPDEIALPDSTARGDVLGAALSFMPSTWRTSSLLVDANLEVDFDESLKGAEDIAYRIELAQLTPFVVVDESLVQSEHGDGLGTSWEAIDDRWQILARYSELYESQPDRVKLGALANTYRSIGRRHLEDHLWSYNAIFAFLKALYYEPNPRKGDVVECISAVGGRPLRELAASLNQTFALSDE